MENKIFFHKSLRSKVVDYLKEEIFLENYKGGERIFESKIAKELNISRAPVREAIKELENQGLIINVPRKGSFLIEFSQDDIKELFDISILLESRILELLINKDILDNEDYPKLTAIVDEMVEITQNDNIDKKKKIIEVNKRDFAFHKFLWEKSNNKLTTNILSNLHYQMQLVMINDFKLENNLASSARKHYNIIDSLRKKDIKKMKMALIDHIIPYNNELMGGFAK
jgi:DNA-binding GntR family transcriptional regulator